MAKEGFQVAASQKDLKDARVVSEQDVKLILEREVKDMGPLCEMELKNDKGVTGSKRMAEVDDGNPMLVHVLAVDDSFVDRKIIERLVKCASFMVTAVDSGAKALEVLSTNNNINLIITDYCMPEMSGYELLKHVKEAPTLKDIPVVIMSSENVPARIQRCLEEGAEEFLLKPVRLADVKRLKTYVFPPRENTVDLHNLQCKKPKFSSDGFQVQSPERGPRLGSVTVA